MLNKNVEQYVMNQLYESTEELKQLESFAKEHRVPIMDPIGMGFVKQLIHLHEPKRILEIGTAIGYSALQMAEVDPNLKIVTIERDEERFEQALENIRKFQEEKRIEVLHGDALEKLPELINKNESFDFIFIDAAKGSYSQFFTAAREMLNEHGVILSDNVLFRGYVAEGADVPKRYQKLAQKIFQYNEWLMQQEDFRTIILPIGDGVALSIKK